MIGDFSASAIVGRNIQNIRTRKRLRQADVCLPCGITQDRFSKIERGRTHITIDLISNMAQIMKVPVAELLEGVPGTDEEQSLSSADRKILRQYSTDQKFRTLVDTFLE